MYPLKFESILKQTLWGGDKIIPFKRLNADLKGVGESWEISGVEDNESVVANGPDKGLTLTDMVRRYRDELVGKRITPVSGINFRCSLNLSMPNKICLFKFILPMNWRKDVIIQWVKLKCGT